jgi:hypothetical protein
MVVGLVLCGKVIIDWGPAMNRDQRASIDSAFVEQVCLTYFVGLAAILVEKLS